MPEPEPTVFIVDDDDAMRNMLVALLQSVDLKTEVFDSATAFLTRYDPGMPGCLLLDLRMPGMSGLELQEHLAQSQIPLPTIVISGHGDVSIAIQVMKAGAVDFIEKPFKHQLLLDRVHEGLAQDARQREQARRAQLAKGRLERLSEREREVMKMIVSGKASKDIAAELGISRKTVGVHRANILAKVGTKSVAELVRVALELRGGWNF